VAAAIRIPIRWIISPSAGQIKRRGNRRLRPCTMVNRLRGRPVFMRMGLCLRVPALLCEQRKAWQEIAN
jgi:hypothetical protein